MKDDYNTYSGKAYRFLTFEGLHHTIQNKNLRFTRVDNLNDPLDNSPVMVPLDWENFLLEKDGSFLQPINSLLIDNVYKSLFVSCFCKNYTTNDSYLMWTHYADNHRQVCFEIDFNNQHPYLGGPSEVTYPECLVTERENQRKGNKKNLGLYLVTTKLKQWSYENEVRLIIDLKHKSINSIKHSLSRDSKYLYVDFDIGQISKVIFGIRSDKNQELKTRDLFVNENLNPKFEKMYIDAKTLTLKSKDHIF